MPLLSMYFSTKLSNFYVGVQNVVAKGQLISKCPFGVFKSCKKPTKFFPGFLPQPLKRGQIKKIRALYTTTDLEDFFTFLNYFFDFDLTSF